ncbi:MAG: hypothetical protein J3K34DRAFT_411106, partial [Monoraphidium minutum]
MALTVPLTLLQHDAAGTPLLARCAADARAAVAVARMVVPGGPLRDMPFGVVSAPLLYLDAIRRERGGAFAAAARVPGLALGLANGLAAARARSSPGSDDVFLCLLESVVAVHPDAMAEMPAAPGALTALVGQLNSERPAPRLQAAVVLAAVTVAAPEACGALLRLPTLAAIVALLRRAAAGAECADSIIACGCAIVVAGQLVEHSKAEGGAARAAAALLAAAPGALR